MKRSTWKLIAVLIAILGGLAGFKYWRISSMIAAYKAMEPPPTVIAAGSAQPIEWQPYLRTTGSVVATQKTVVSAERAGVIKRIAFNSGAQVRAGDVLVELDSAEEKAQLDAAIARAELANLKLQRESRLIGTGAIARSHFDETTAQAKQADAEVETWRAVLSKKTIRAPFAGRVSIRDVNLGDYLAAGAPVVDLQAVDPVYVDFSVPQHNIALVQLNSKIAVSSDAGEFSGEVSAVNPDVDASTRYLRVRATLPNDAEKLRPGMFVQVALSSGKPVAAVTVPATALHRTAYAVSVFVIETTRGADGKTRATARERFVDLGNAEGDQVVILSGIKPGEQVAIAGVFKLRDATPVEINNSALPPDASRGQPANS